MVHSLSQETNQELTWHQLKYAILRNFGGKDNISPVDSFKLFINTINTDEEVMCSCAFKYCQNNYMYMFDTFVKLYFCSEKKVIGKHYVQLMKNFGSFCPVGNF